jgi:hypothetical protein
MHAPFAPISADDIADWARRHAQPEPAARRRFIQAAAVYAVADDPHLSAELRLFGSAALSLLYGGRRVAGDLDFLCRPTDPPPDASAKQAIAARVNACMNRVLRRFVPFDDVWRPLLAREVKVQLCAEPRLDAPCQWVELRFDPPRPILAYGLAEAIGLKLTSMLYPVGPNVVKAKPRDQDVYDVADAVARLSVARDPAVAHGLRAIAGREPPKTKVADEFVTLARHHYAQRHAAGEYDIPWEQAWPIYRDWAQPFPGAERFPTI